MRIFERLFKRNFLLLIYVRVSDLKFPIIIPIPLGLAEDIIESILQVFRILCMIVPGLRKYLGKIRAGAFHIDINKYLDLPLELLLELRKAGRLTLVEVNSDEAQVYIKLI